MKRGQQVGFSQRIQLDWLEYTTNLMLAGHSEGEIVVALRDRLKQKLSVGNEPKRGTREKAITILTKVWVRVPKELRTLRDEGLELIERMHLKDRMLVHWCMCTAVYPFFGTIADATGRLLHLQETAAAIQVQRRIREQLGERETVARATRRILRVFVDWGVLLETGEKGLYRGAAKHVADDPQLIIWAIKAILLAGNNESRPALTLVRGPHLFPFDITLPSMRVLEACNFFEVAHHGIDHDVFLSLPKATSN